MSAMECPQPEVEYAETQAAGVDRRADVGVHLVQRVQRESRQVELVHQVPL